ncbi:hypothetical protein HMPREF0454_01120 [Hafnia alvei ATCC 51873]|uniref:Uncharacterized protein n=1 Tax=Hafnia alvei ATCC 51873 TaxID=1002364 RepID=G9Y3B8_HAFAL|nr:hypothetical protein HMPREF0454_01120 [Hafnia alvei ATCC 51873]
MLRIYGLNVSAPDHRNVIVYTNVVFTVIVNGCGLMDLITVKMDYLIEFYDFLSMICGGYIFVFVLIK